MKLYGGFSGTETTIDERVKTADGAAWDFETPAVFLQTVTPGSASAMITCNVVLTLDGITLDGNKTNGYSKWNGVYSNNGTITIANCIIRDFKNTDDGGGFDIRGSNNDEVYNCLIENNESAQAAGAYLERVTMHHCIVRNNKTTKSDDGNLAGGGGGLFLSANGATAYDCLIEGNECCYGGGVFFRSNNTTGTRLLYNCIIVNNKAYSGSGIGFRGNYSTSKNICATNDKVYNCIIANNQAVSEGFGTPTARNGKGAGVMFPFDDAINSGAFPSGANNGTLSNCILYNNTDVDGAVLNVEVTSTSTSPVFNNNIIENASIANLTQTACVVNSTPADLFRNIASGDYTLPLTGFVGLDSGDAAGLTFADNKDYAGNLRIQGAAVEIGVYEVENTRVAVTISISEGITDASESGSELKTPGVYSLTFKKADGYSHVNVLVNGVWTEPTLDGGDTYTLDYTVATGTPTTVAVSAYQFAGNVVPVTEDTYIRNNNGEPDKNLSRATVIGVAGDISNAYSNTKGFLYFDLNPYKAELLAAGYNKAELKVVYAPGGNTKSFDEYLDVRTVQDTVKTLGLSELTWNNSKEVASIYSGDEVAQSAKSLYGQIPSDVEDVIDLTNSVLETLNSDGLLYCQLALITPAGNDKNDGHLAWCYSFENGNPDYVPQLVFSAVDTVTIAASEGIALSGEDTVVVARGSTYAVTFSVETGYEDPVVTLNEVPYTLSEAVEGIYTVNIPATTGNVKVSITCDNISTGLLQVGANNAPVKYYTLQGVEIREPVKGNIYIVKQGAKVRKVMVR